MNEVGGELESMKVYDVKVEGGDCKGIYLGKFNSNKRRKVYRHMILLDIPYSGSRLERFHIRRFKEKDFIEERGVILLIKSLNNIIPNNQMPFYRDLLKEKGILEKKTE